MSSYSLPRNINCLFFFLVLSAFNLTHLHGQVTGISVEEFYTDNGSIAGYPAGHTTYRIYANTQNASDRVYSVSGIATAPMSLSVTGSGIWNVNSGGVTGDALPCAIYNVLPLAQYDSYVTIGVSCNSDGSLNPIYKVEDTGQPWQNQAFNTTPYGIGQVVSNSFIGSSWFALPDNPFTEAGSDLKVMLAQITTDGDICGTFNLQVFPSYAGPGSQSINQRFSFGSTSGCVPGCTDPSAVNYDSQATYADGNCLLPCSLQILSEVFFYVCDGIEEGLVEITVSGNQGYLSYSVNGIEQGLSSNNTIQIYGQTNENIIVQISDTRFDNPLANPTGLVCQIEETYFVLLNEGCNDVNACNYDPSVNCNDGSCNYPGCNDINACNYNSFAGCNNGTCTYPGCNNPNACNYSPAAGCSDNSCVFPGCNDSQACNYDASAGCDDGSCLYVSAPCNDNNSNTLNDQINSNCTCVGQLLGCTNASACNYNPLAIIDNGQCVFPGCTNNTACNYNAAAGCNDGTCIYPGCTDPSAFNFDEAAGCEDGSCLYEGCTLPNACNYNPLADINDGSCTFPGCTNNTACNFQPSAGCDNGTCLFTATPCNDGNPNTVNDQLNSDCNCVGQLLGCTNSSACNYNPIAEVDNGSCLFTGAECNDNNANTMLDQITASCNCQGTPYNYGSMGNQGTINLCPGATANVFTVTAPLNLASYAAQWYYREGTAGCPSDNSTAGWELIAGANSLSFTPTEFTGTRTFACFITPSAIYNIPARWATGCRTVSYYAFSAQAIIGNPNITSFSSVTYAVNPISGHTYNWNITNGAITSGQGTNVITVLWGQNGPYQVTLTEGNNTCNDTSTLLVVNGNCSLSVNAIATNGASLCQGETATLEAITQTTGVNFQWYLNGNVIAGAINSSLEIYTGGNYQVLISQGACTAVSQTLVINTLSPTAAPQLVVDYLSAGCSGGSAIVSAVGGSFSTYAWNNGATSASIEVNESGDYSVQLTDANGCQASAGPVSVNLSLQEALPICIVTVDPLTNKNIVVWEPQFSEVSASYTVYKEANVADEYVAIGNVSYGQDGIFEDVNSNAAVQANRYKLAVMDTCGVESSLSGLHKTIHLTSNVGLNGTVNLIWSHYEGFYFGSYNIYRGDNPGNLTLLSTIASNLNSYTDLTPPTGVYYYVIEVEGISCDPSRDVIVSRSNVVYIAPNSIADVNASILSVYPIPASDELHLALSSDALGNDVVLTSTTGAIVVQQKITSEKMSLSLEACAAGFYILQVRDGNSVVATRRVVVE